MEREGGDGGEERKRGRRDRGREGQREGRREGGRVERKSGEEEIKRERQRKIGNIQEAVKHSKLMVADCLKVKRKVAVKTS